MQVGQTEIESTNYYATEKLGSKIETFLRGNR